MNAKDQKTLKNIYDALAGAVSGTGPEFYDSFYRGGGEKLFKDFEWILERNCGMKFVNPEYKAVPMQSKKGDGPNGEDFFYKGKWMIVDQTGAMALTGLTSKEEAELVIREVCNAA